MSSLPLEVLFEDQHLIAVSKPSGMLTEGGGAREMDLEQAVGAYVGKRVFCCHRLDRLTSGIVLLRKDGRFKAQLASMFENHRIRKLYWALVEGVWDKGIRKIETQIASSGGGVWQNVSSGGKVSVSTFQLLGVSKETNQSLLGALLKTGRTHQARLHCLAANCPIWGDPVYGAGPKEFFGLHAREVRMRHPGTSEDLVFLADPPQTWDESLRALGLL